MVNTRNQNRDVGNDSGIQLRSAQGQGNDEGSASHNQNQLPGTSRPQHQVPNPPAAVTLDAATMEAIRALIVQTVQGLNPVTPPIVPEVGLGDQSANTEDDRVQAANPGSGSTFGRALKTFTSMKPDSYDGTGELVKMTIREPFCN